MQPTYVRNNFLSDELGDYIAAHTSPPDETQQHLRAITREKVGDHAQMQIGDDQSVFMELLVRSIGAKRAIEVGTFTGYSSIAIARGLGPEGHLLCCDVSEEWTAYAVDHWQRAGLSDRIELRIAPAIDTIRQLQSDVIFDFGFIDADKPAYLDYYEALLPHVRPNGLLLVDNTLQNGRVLDMTNHDPSPVVIRVFNDRVRNDDRVTSVLLPIGDGITMIQKH